MTNIPQPKGHDERIVRYSEIHKIKGQDYEALIKAVDPKEGDIIFEGCAGYADVSMHLIEETKNYKQPIEIYLQDESAVQMGRAFENLQLPEGHMILGDVRSTGLPEGMFDKAVIKMGVHEVSKEGQPDIFNEMYRILKLKGKFIIWEVSLGKDTQEIFSDIVKRKNELAGFDLIAKNRYLQRHDELVRLFASAGFQDITDEYFIDYTFDAKGRSQELVSKDRIALFKEKGKLSDEDELVLSRKAQERLDKLLLYIRQRVPEEMKEILKYKDTGENIEVTVNKVIMSGIK